MMMISRISLSKKNHLPSTVAGLMVMVLASQAALAAPRQGNLKRAEPTLAAPKKLNLVRPTRPTDLEPSQPIVGTEVFVERYPDGTIKVEREVTLDDEGNYVNHGPWRMWNQAGKLVAEGSFEYGSRSSIWTRWHDRNDSKLLSQAPFNRFSTPFISQVNFDQGVMDGEWSIFDSQQRRCCQISLYRGKRHGTTLFWLPDGTVLQQATFDQGVPTGDVLQLDARSGKLAQAKNYLDGRQRITRKTTHRRGKQKFEGNYLAPPSMQTVKDDFWTLTFAKYEPQGEELRHGKWQEWYSNGQLKMSGQYDRDKKVGQFTYWHSNGQKATEGYYEAGKHDGTWVWWHQNGQKSVTGSFEDGMLIDQWRWWAQNGKLTKQLVHDGTRTFESLAIDEPATDIKSARTQGRVRR